MAHEATTTPAKSRTAPPLPPVPCDADRLARGHMMESGYRPPQKPARTAH